MNFLSYQIDEKEQRLRSRWLLLTQIIYFGYPLVSLALMGYMAPVSLKTIGTLFGTYLFIMLFINAPCFWIIYHCAYKKHGTVCLMLCLVLGAIGYVTQGIQLLKGPYKLGDFLIEGVGFALYTWWYILSWQLRKINKKILSQFHGPQEHLDAVEVFNQATTLEELDRKFVETINKWPQFEPYSTAKYQLKKDELTT